MRSAYGLMAAAALGASVACLAWMVVEGSRQAGGVGVVRDSAGAAVRILPGRSVAAYHAFVVALSLLPSACAAARLAQRSPRWAAGVAVLGLCATAGLAGFAYEALQAEIRLTPRGLVYRSGSRQAALAWHDIRAMVVHWTPRSQSVLLGTDNARVRLDLSAFAPRDRVNLVRFLPGQAQLVPAPPHDPEVRVWRRAFRSQTPPAQP